MSADDCPLPDPEGHLSIRIPSSSIEVANKEVKPILNEVHAGNGKKRGPYKSYTASEKLGLPNGLLSVVLLTLQGILLLSLLTDP